MQNRYQMTKYTLENAPQEVFFIRMPQKMNRKRVGQQLQVSPKMSPTLRKSCSRCTLSFFFQYWLSSFSPSDSYSFISIAENTKTCSKKKSRKLLLRFTFLDLSLIVIDTLSTLLNGPPYLHHCVVQSTSNGLSDQWNGSVKLIYLRIYFGRNGK